MFGRIHRMLRKIRWRFGDTTVRTHVFGPASFRCRNSVEVSRTAGFGEEAAALGAFLFLLRPDDVVWDIGASVGLFAIHTAPRVKRVEAFEPDAATAERLRQNAVVNGLDIGVHQLALGAEPGEVELHTDGLAGNAPSLVALGRHRATTTTRMDTIDAAVERITPPTVLKIDVEGAEGLVFDGARGLLGSDRRPRLIFVEVHRAFLPHYGSEPDAVERALQAGGYRTLSTTSRAEQYHLVAVPD